MNISRGRIGQFKILQTESSLSKHLVDTELFTEASLFSFLEKYKSIIIKPAFGPGDIKVFLENNKYKVVSNNKEKILEDKKILYRYLVENEIKQKYHIITQGKQTSPFFQNAFQYYVTVHRDTSTKKWFITSKTEKIRSVFGKFFYMCFLKKIEALSLLAASKLGEYFPRCNTLVIDIMYDLKGAIWIQDTYLHLPNSKWSQHHTLTNNPFLHSYVPDTDLLTKFTFQHFLHKYNDIIIKPCIGQNGIGIVQISTNDFIYEIHSGNRKIIKSTLEETFQYIEEKFLYKKNYIVQQKLSLASINGCPIDVRVIAQKVDSNWTITGKVTKVAGKDFFVTNAAQKLLPLEDAICNSNIPSINMNTLQERIDDVCLIAAKQLEQNNTNIKIIGFDIGITQQGNLSIIEGNYTPDLSMFYQLHNKDIYWRILNNIRKGR
ncbi:YheC/YheD family protein [Bacillus sp. FJAT-49736]|uniref:YheC/YheD family protein n=1 Tax=Bacillus sp. FJAT-49736 TaxID=2833582 RepID=UPI001BC9B628|nr:YheC/YheD family protein [Bacillus sp. FJAT-49736]MBS4172204.1 YheC/YheD family protein [Bacillus sp. FJAT-49736]